MILSSRHGIVTVGVDEPCAVAGAEGQPSAWSLLRSETNPVKDLCPQMKLSVDS
jgi:hypothetical protein